MTCTATIQCLLFELAKTLTKPVNSKPVDIVILAEVLEAHGQHQARRRLALKLRSKAVTENLMSIGDFIKIFQKRDDIKRGKCSGPKIVLSINPTARSIMVPGLNGPTITAAYKDAWPSLSSLSFAQLIQEAIDSIHESLHETKAYANSSSVDYCHYSTSSADFADSSPVDLDPKYLSKLIFSRTW